MLSLDHIHFYVDNAQKWRDWFISVLGCQGVGKTSDRLTQTEILRFSNNLTFLLSSALNSDSIVAQYLENHPSGVVDVAFRVDNLDSILERVPELSLSVRSSKNIRQVTIEREETLRHTLIEYKIGDFKSSSLQQYPKILGIDHLVLNVRPGELETTVSWYEKVLGFSREQTFNIQTEKSGLYSQVMLHPSTGLKFPINQPISSNSQIQEFINLNNGIGIQHIALATPNLSKTVRQLRQGGLKFISVPDEYYQSLKSRANQPNLSPRDWEEIEQQKILVDYQEDSVLLQIFSQPIFEQPTFFWEFIERRRQMQGFGERNFQALFEAIEQEQAKRGSL